MFECCYNSPLSFMHHCINLRGSLHFFLQVEPIYKLHDCWEFPPAGNYMYSTSTHVHSPRTHPHTPPLNASSVTERRPECQARQNRHHLRVRHALTCVDVAAYFGGNLLVRVCRREFRNRPTPRFLAAVLLSVVRASSPVRPVLPVTSRHPSLQNCRQNNETHYFHYN